MSIPQSVYLSSKRWLVSAGLVSAFWVAGMGQAAALSAPFTVSSYSGAGSYGTVDVTTSGNKIKFSVDAPAGYKLRQFGFNSDINLNKYKFVGLDGWTLTKNKSMDGFGTFDYVLTGTKTANLDFNIRWIPGDTPVDYFAGNPDYFYAAHMTPNGGTGIVHFVAAVPEMETWAMMGAGIGFLGWYTRRRKQRLDTNVVAAA